MGPINVVEQWRSGGTHWRIIEDPSPLTLVLQVHPPDGLWQDVNHLRLRSEADRARLMMLLQAQSTMWDGEP